jgi:hypothetical protein
VARFRSNPRQLKLPIAGIDSAGGGRLTEWPQKPRIFPQLYPQDINRISTGTAGPAPEGDAELSTLSTAPTSVD